MKESTEGTLLVLGAVLLGEPVTLTVVAGGLLVLGGVLLVQHHRSDEPYSESRVPLSRRG